MIKIYVTKIQITLYALTSNHKIMISFTVNLYHIWGKSLQKEHKIWITSDLKQSRNQAL